MVPTRRVMFGRWGTQRTRGVGSLTSGSLELSGQPMQPLLVDPFQGRSGSTLMMTILATSTAIAVDRVYPYENRYLTYLCRLVEHLDQPFTQDAEWSMQQLLKGPDTQIGPIPFSPLSIEPSDLAIRVTRHLWMAFSESLATRGHEPYRYYAEKTWADNLELLARAGIKSKLINLVRDPRDVAASIRAFDQKRGYYGFGRKADQSDDDYFATLVNGMREKLKGMHARAERHDHLWVRYEDMITNRSDVIKQLSSWLDLELQLDAGAPKGRDYSRHATTSSPAESVGRWQRDLSGSEAAYIEKHLADEMHRLGYQK